MKHDFKSDASTAWPFSLPDDGWYQLMPRGEFPGKDELTGEEVTQVIDQEAIDSMMREFRRASAAENFAGLLIDYDHFSEDLDKPTVAAGWMIDLAERCDGIWFRARWSAEGETNLKSGCYRNISPSLRGIFIGQGRVRPMLIDRAGLTNDPKFKNMRPLSNRGGGDSSRKSPEVKETKMKRLLAMLGLASDASEDSAVEAVTKLKNRADQVDGLQTKLDSANAELKTANQKALKAEADAFCDANAAKIQNRAAVHAQYLKDPEGTKSLVESMNAGSQKASLKDRATRQPGQDNTTSDDVQSKAQQFEDKVLAYKSTNRCSYDQAFDAVAKAHPDLLKDEQDSDD